LSYISTFTKNLFGAADGRLDESRLGRLKIAQDAVLGLRTMSDIKSREGRLKITQDESPGLEAKYSQHCVLSLGDRAGFADISIHAVSERPAISGPSSRPIYTGQSHA
jgi:hypothetical protein